MERRKFTRFALEYPVLISWRDPQGVSHRAEGVTRNVSVSGVFFRGRTSPPVGAQIEFNVFFPWIESRESTLRMTTEGTVVRASLQMIGGERDGFALEGCGDYILEKLENGG